MQQIYGHQHSVSMPNQQLHMVFIRRGGQRSLHNHTKYDGNTRYNIYVNNIFLGGREATQLHLQMARRNSD